MKNEPKKFHFTNDQPLDELILFDNESSDSPDDENVT